MSAPIVRLENASLPTLVLDQFAGFAIQSLDLGFPSVRAVVNDAPDVSGTLDTTALFGARTITVPLKLTRRAPSDSLEGLRRRLKAYLAPALRSTMFVTLDDGVERRATVRGSNFSGGLDKPNRATVVAQWVAPSGIFESSTLYTVDVLAGGSGAELGRSYDLTFDRTYPASSVIGSRAVVNAGDVDAFPMIKIYGPCTNPVVSNMTQSKSLTFSGLTIAAGDYLEIDTRAKTIRTNSLAASSQYSKLVFPSSKWWTLSPGSNTVRFVPSTFSSGAAMRVEWRDAWI